MEEATGSNPVLSKFFSSRWFEHEVSGMARPNLRKLDPRLMERLKARGYGNLKEFALANGLPYTTILPYFDINESSKSVETLVSISSALDMNIDELFSVLLSKNDPEIAAK